jgi:uncharacterized protein (TIGR02466 family)
MSETLSLFATRIHRAPLGGKTPNEVRLDLQEACEALEVEDKAGRKWCRDNGYKGYTSYASLGDLPQRFTAFDDLRRALDKHVAKFSTEVGFDLAGGKLKLDSMWVNVMPSGGVHTGHIHPHSVISGTYYVAVPEGASTLKFEDPRLAMMMAAPTRKVDAARDLQTFIFLSPAEGEVILWESWLRHEVALNKSTSKRISISFNYAWV